MKVNENRERQNHHQDLEMEDDDCGTRGNGLGGLAPPGREAVLGVVGGGSDGKVSDI